MLLNRFLQLSMLLGFAAVANARVHGKSLTLTARDGVRISGLLYTAPHPKAVVLLFHQAGTATMRFLISP
jgi:hypothetical protein